jgi:acetoin utilization protein AcuB
MRGRARLAPPSSGGGRGIGRPTMAQALLAGVHMLTASDLMTEKPVTIRDSETVRRATELLQTLDIRHLPVLDDDGNLVGMLSDRDLRGVMVPYVLGSEYIGNVRAALDAKVATIMNADVLSVEVEADAAEIVDLMLDNKIGAVPVLDGDGSLVGIVSYVDVLRALPLEAGDAAE